MEKRIENRNITHVIGDAAMTLFSIAILGITFYGVSAMTPTTRSALVSQGTSGVLGAKSTSTGSVTFFPQSLGTLPYIKTSTFTGTTQLTHNSVSEIAFTALEATTYTFSPVTIKNTSTEPKTVVITPSYSVDGSYTTISLQYDGLTVPIIDAKGTVTPAEIIIDPNTITPITIIVQPTTPLQVPPVLSLGFTEKP